MGLVRPTYFKTAGDFRSWLRRHHARRSELLVGFHKKATGKPSLTYPEALDEALCWGWIDGVRRTVDDGGYTIRFTPRRPGSYWSAVNTRKAEALIAAGRVAQPGLAAFHRRDTARTADYSYERERGFDAAQLRAFKAQRKAWAFFAALPPGYRRVSIAYVTSAKRDDTRERRLAQLIACSARGARLPMLPQPKNRKGP